MADAQVPVAKQPEKKDVVPGYLDTFRNEFDRLFSRFSRSMFPWGSPFFETAVPSLSDSAILPVPAADIAEDDTAFTLTAELPGLTSEQVDVSVKGDYLVIQGEKQTETKQEEKNWHLVERSQGSFRRSFLLPEAVDRDKITAELSKGVLTVKLPKTASKEPAKKIEVKPA